MRSTRNFLHLIGKIFVVMGFIICLAMGYNQDSLAAPQTTWKPDSPQTIVVHALGGTYDWMARELTQVLPDYLGQPVSVRCVTGGEGGNAVDFVQKTKPDGRNFTMGGVGIYLVLSIEKRYSWDIKDLPIVLAMDSAPYVIATSAKSQYKSYEDLSKLKKAVRIAVPGGNLGIIALIMDFEKKGIEFKAGRLKGASDASLPVIAGDADILIGGLVGPNFEKIKAGDLRPLLVYDTKRYYLLPDVPTHVELGMPREWAYFRVIRLTQVAPGTPEHIVKGLREGLTKAMKDKRMEEWSKKIDLEIIIFTEEETKERIRFLVESFKKRPDIVKEYF